MKKPIEQALVDASDALEYLKAHLRELSMEEKIDTGARLRPVAKMAAELDSTIKEDIKKQRRNKPGTVFGTMFKAVLKLVPTERFLSKQLKEEDPKTYARYAVNDPVSRITYEAR
jgi:hypothetical protein